jgi:pseudouridine-5'-monophosphatase
MPAPVTHVLFDLDGTLLDTESLYTQAAERVCARHGSHYDLALKRRIMGGDTLRGAQLVVQTLGLPITPEAYIREREAELHILLPQLTPMTGAPELVALLAAQGIPMAIATSGHRGITEEKLSYAPFLRAIGTLVCGDDPRLEHPKPAPDIYLLAAAELGATAPACVVLEDSLNGVLAGVAAGMRTIALVDPRWGFARDDFAAHAHVVSSLLEVTLPLLDSARP